MYWHAEQSPRTSLFAIWHNRPTQAIREPSARCRIESCCTIVGAAACLPAVLSLLLPRARDAAADAQGRAAAVLCTAHVLRGAAAGRERSRNAEALPQLLELLGDPAVGQSEDACMRPAVLAAVHALLDAYPGETLAPHAAPLATAALLLRASDWRGSGGGGPGDNAAPAADSKAAGQQAAESEGLLHHLASVVTAADGGAASHPINCTIISCIDVLLQQQRPAILCQVRGLLVAGRGPSCSGHRACRQERLGRRQYALIVLPRRLFNEM
jgi:hypothetical protein